ncbi:hypothetical protein GCM10027578_40410 [Spirosoma luteolum]
MPPIPSDALVAQIARLQGADGLFPSERRQPLLGYRRPDTNVFFTAATLFTLQSLGPQLSVRAQQAVAAMTARAVAQGYPRFRNKDGLATYNFWPTRPSQHFSNGYVFRHFEHFRIPDDIDDTALVYLTSPPPVATRQWLADKLPQHANRTRLTIRNTWPDYRPLRVYSTWFGRDMPIDFDACALSNLLYCRYALGLPPDGHQADTLTYLRDIVLSGRYQTDPFTCAPHYARTTLIGYHLSRLVSAFAIPELEPIRARLLTDAQQTPRPANRIEQLLLAITRLRLGDTPPPVDLTAIERDFAGFYFFIAGLLTAYETPWLRRWASYPITQMRWHCDAHCWALVLEYGCLSGQLPAGGDQ